MRSCSTYLTPSMAWNRKWQHCPSLSTSLPALGRRQGRIAHRYYYNSVQLVCVCKSVDVNVLEHMTKGYHMCVQARVSIKLELALHPKLCLLCSLEWTGLWAACGAGWLVDVALCLWGHWVHAAYSAVCPAACNLCPRGDRFNGQHFKVSQNG